MPTNSEAKVYFFNDGVKLNIRNKKKLKSFLISLFKIEKKRLGTINYIFSNDKKMLKINRTYLHHDFLTDIITFELNSIGQPVVADIYISLERVKENSRNIGTKINSELHRVIFHGALHLCGYSDKGKNELNKMRGKENYYLNKYFN